MYVNEDQNKCDMSGCGRTIKVGLEPHDEDEGGYEFTFPEGAVDVCRLCADQGDHRWTYDESGHPVWYTNDDGFTMVPLTFAEVHPFLRNDWKKCDPDVVNG